MPGVRELFQSRKKEEEEENQVLAHYKRFMNQGPAYYGDLDEVDGKLLRYEREAEEEGKIVLSVCERNLIAFSILRLGGIFHQCSGGSRPTSRYANATTTKSSSLTFCVA